MRLDTLFSHLMTVFTGDLLTPLSCLRIQRFQSPILYML